MEPIVAPPGSVAVCPAINQPQSAGADSPSAASRLPLIASLLSLAFGGMAVWRVLMVPGRAGTGLAWLAAASALTGFLVATRTQLRPIAARWSRPLEALLVELFLINVLASFAVAGDTRFFNLFLVISISLAGWMLEASWFFAVWAVAGSVWLVIAMFADQPWEQQFGRVGGGFALSLLLLVARRLLSPAQLVQGPISLAPDPEIQALRTSLHEEKHHRERLDASRQQDGLERLKLAQELANLRLEHGRAVANWQAADAARQQAQQLRQLVEEQRTNEAKARAAAEAEQLKLQLQVEELRRSPPPVPAPTGPSEEEWLAELDRVEGEKKRLELSVAEQQERSTQAEGALRATEAALRKLETELRTLKADHEQTEVEWQECELKRQHAEKECQRLKADASSIEQELSQSRDERAQLRRELQEAQARKNKFLTEQQSELDQTLTMLRDLPVVIVHWDQAGMLGRIAGGGLELLGWQLNESHASIETLVESNEALRAPLRSVQADQDYTIELEQNNRLLCVRCTPWKNDLGQIRGLLGLVADLTAVRKAESRAKKANPTEQPRAEAEPPSLRLLPFSPDGDAAAAPLLPHYSGRALLIDDRREPRRVMTFLLERLGLSVEVADFLDQVEQLAASGRHAIVFLARCMLDKQPQLARRLREQGVAAPFVAILDADANSAQDAACVEAGCDRVLHLPLTATALGESLADYLSEAEPNGEQVVVETPLISHRRQDPAFVALISTFVDDLPGKVAELWSALCVADVAGLIKGAHQVKEAANLYGYPELAQQSGRLEQAILDGQSAAALRTFLKDVETTTRRCTRGLAA